MTAEKTAQTTDATKVKSLRRIIGTVVSNKMQKTVVLEASRLVKHPKYGKYYKKYQKLKAHDEKSECGVGDKIEVIECRPLSKEKRFRLSKIIEKAKVVEFSKQQVAG